MSALTSKEKIARQNNMVKSLLDVVTSTDGHGEAKEERKKSSGEKKFLFSPFWNELPPVQNNNARVGIFSRHAY